MWLEPALPNVEVGGTVLMLIRLFLTELFRELFTVEALLLETIVSIGNVVKDRGCTTGGRWQFRGSGELGLDRHAREDMWTEWKILAVSFRAPSTLGWRPSLLKNDGRSQKRLKLSMYVKL